MLNLFKNFYGNFKGILTVFNGYQRLFTFLDAGNEVAKLKAKRFSLVNFEFFANYLFFEIRFATQGYCLIGVIKRAVF